MLVICIIEILVLLMIALFLWSNIPSSGNFGDNKSIQIGHMRHGYGTVGPKKISAFSNNQQLGSLKNSGKPLDTIKASYNQMPSHV